MVSNYEFTPSGHSTLTTHAGESFLKIFDTASLTEIKTIPVGKSPTNSIFDADGRHAYVTNWGSDTVSVIDVAEWREAKSIAVGRKPFAIYLFNPARGEMIGNR